MLVLPEEISICISSLNKRDLPLPMWVGIFQSVEGPKEPKSKRRTRSLSLWAGMFPPLPGFFFPCPWTLELLDLGSSDSGTYTRPLASAWELHHQLSWFLDLCTQTIIPLTVLALQFADSRVRDFSVSITMKANSYNKSLIYLYPMFFPLGEPWPIQCLGINQTKYVPDCGGGEIIKFYWKTKEKLY